nr:MAG TPA: hypothetical protein [Bacteriophage sp.]DAO41361.1 MAG TPA: hypothetical protein [Caudoviricetes sp.]
MRCYVLKHIICFHFYESKFAFVKMKVYICTTIRPWQYQRYNKVQYTKIEIKT